MSDVKATSLRMTGFSLPALGLNTLVTAVFVFMPPLYAEHRGLGAATVGTIFLLAKFVDMAAAPIWGLFMDSYKTRWGRRRPWLVLATPILMVAVFFVYHPPENVTGLYLFLWLSILYIGWDAWTISHTAWALELSRDYDRRSRITGLLQLMAIIGGILVSLVPAIMEQLGEPTYEDKTSAIGSFIIILLPLTVIACILSIPERTTPNQPRANFRKGATLIIKNMPLLRLLLANAMLSFAWALLQALFVFYVAYSLNLKDWVGFTLIFLAVGGLLCLPLWIKLSEHWNKHQAMQFAMLSGAGALLLLLVLPQQNVVLTAIAFLIVGINTSANEFLPRAMLADICDADHIESGSERMGLYFSFLQVSTKFGAGLSIFVGFSLLTVIGFDAEAGKDNSAEALRNLRYLMVGLPGLAYAIVSIILLKYPISRENQQEMRSIIEEREKRSLERL